MNYNITQFQKAKSVTQNITTEKLNLTNKQLLGLFIHVCIALCTIVGHNTAQNRPANFPSYPSDKTGWEERLQNDLFYAEWDVKPYRIFRTTSRT